MQTEIMYGPAYATAKVTLSAGEVVRAEAGAMLAMSQGVAMETSTQGGVLKGLRRSVLGCLAVRSHRSVLGCLAVRLRRRRRAFRSHREHLAAQSRPAGRSGSTPSAPRP